MAQTEATREALSRDNFCCMWCLHRENRVRHVFDYVPGYHPLMGGGHHAFKRSRVDESVAIIGLCPEHHWKVENARIPKVEIVALLSKIVGIDLYRRYRQFCKWNDEEWSKHYDSTNQELGQREGLDQEVIE